VKVCGARKYRFIASDLRTSTTSNGAATGWDWSFTGVLGASATIDSGTVNSKVIIVSFSSNAAAVMGDSVKVRYSSNCGYSSWKVLKLSNTLLVPPAAPFSILATPLIINECGNRVYRYTAPALTAGSTNFAPATGYLWSFVGTLGNNAIIDSGTVNSGVIRVVYTSNSAAAYGDSVRVAYLSSCGVTANKSYKLTNSALNVPSLPTAITQTLVSNVCGARVYRYTAPALTSATATSPVTTGYSWTMPFGLVGATGVLDSGSLDGRVICVKFSSNAASSIGDSIKLAYVSGCGIGISRPEKLSIIARTGCPSLPIAVLRQTDEQIKSLNAVKVDITPNPSASQFKLKASSLESTYEQASAVVIDIHGRVVKTITFTTNETITFGNELVPGAYLVKVILGNEQKLIKVIKQ
jgi:hypothetical protein